MGPVPTIYAQATAPGRAGVSVVRISGPQAHEIAARLMQDLPAPRQARLRKLTDPESGTLIDEALVLVFEAGQSFTGDPVVELQCHGSVAVVERLSGCLRALGAELAEPGGFTRRALDNGRMDLTQVEGLADLIDAETEAQRSQAQWVAEGGLSEVIEGWRAKLVRARALCEAVIDFADEDVPVDVSPEVRALIETSMAEITVRLRGSSGAQEVRQGFDVALVGLPNSGKSTLVNAIAGREVALTSPIAGTTRDVLEVRLNLEGLPVRVLDLAGMRETDDQVEGLGVSRAMERARAAPLRIFLMDEKGQLPEGLERQTSDILVQGKADLGGHGVSGLTGQGLDQLLEAVYDRLKDRVLGDERLTRDRHVVALEACRANLCVALGLLGDGGVEDLIAEELRAATQCLDRIIGRVDVEDLLDVVFQSFCIGK